MRWSELRGFSRGGATTLRRFAAYAAARLAVFSSAVAHPGLVRCMGRYLLFVLAPTLLASCATSPMTPREAESARVNSEPWDPDHHDDTSGFTNRDLASL